MKILTTYLRFGVLALCTVMCCAAYADTPTNAPTNELGRTVDNKPLSTDQFKDKVLVLYFWSSKSCEGCMGAFSALDGIQDSAGSDRLQVVAINSKDSRRRFTDAAETLTFSDVLLTRDKGGKIAEDYGVSDLPAFVVLGPDGKISNRVKMPGYGSLVLKELIQHVELAFIESRKPDASKQALTSNP